MMMAQAEIGRLSHRGARAGVFKWKMPVLVDGCLHSRRGTHHQDALPATQ